jgi:hypothetical protein
MKGSFVKPKIAHLGTQQNVVAALIILVKCCSAEAEALSAARIEEAAPVCPVE